jgi:photosystem II stability/assembly factor-like uncharacterized protein
VHGEEPDRIYVATHTGLFLAGPDGSATRVSPRRDDLMSLERHPEDANLLYASGHPESGGNLGLLESRDAGRSWRQISEGAGGSADFHTIAASRTETIYGVFGGLHVSHDGGRVWTKVGPIPDGLFDMAVSSRDAGTVFGATRQGLLKSTDGGKSWAFAYPARLPATMVQVLPDGTVYAFIVTEGLVRALEPEREWRPVSDAFGEQVLRDLTVHAEDQNRL